MATCLTHRKGAKILAPGHFETWAPIIESCYALRLNYLLLSVTNPLPQLDIYPQPQFSRQLTFGILAQETQKLGDKFNLLNQSHVKRKMKQQQTCLCGKF